MKRALFTLVAAIALATVTSTAEAGQFILRAATSADCVTLCQRYGLTEIREVRQDGTQDTCVVVADTQSPAEDAALQAAVAADPLTQAFEIDTSQQLAETTSSAGSLAQSTAAILEGFAGQSPVPYFGGLVSSAYLSQPAASLIKLSSAQPVATGAGVVAVIDTGVDPGHPMLAASLVSGYDFVNDVAGIPTDFGEISQSTAAILEQATQPDTVALLNQSTAAILEQSTAAILESSQLPAAFGHGTMIAGLVHLVAPTAWIMPVKAFTADGTAQLSDLVRAIYFAVDNGATVINMSFTLAVPSQAMANAIAYATAKGVLCVGAAGNDGVQVTTYPSGWPGVVDVASTTYSDQRSSFSNWSARVDVSAPGEALITAYPGNHYAAAWGTSFSTALLSGAAALVHQYVPRFTEHDFEEMLEHGPSVPAGMGEARLDLVEMLEEMFKGYVK